MRNAASEDKGLGFALSGNFYSDFLLWLADDATGKQWLTFIDAKGMRNIDLNHPKRGLYKQVKDLEPSLMKLGDAPLVLNAFMLSYTSFSDLLNVHGKTEQADLEQRHVLFMKDGGSVYLRIMLSILH